jgi:manganese/zinc/iron transport system permease protein
MVGIDWEVLLVACLTALACALPGGFLFLRGATMQIEAVSHSILLGIVLVSLSGFGNSVAFLLLGAAGMGLISVLAGELLSKASGAHTSLVVALIFPGMFASAVILMNSFLRNSHIDLHVVLMGELATVSLDRLEWMDREWGPVAMWKAIWALLGNILFMAAAARKLSISIFDPLLSLTLGHSPRLIHACFMAVVCLCAVAAFDVVGSILTLALFSIPATCSFFWTRRLRSFLWISCSISLMGTALGFFAAYRWDLSLAGCITTALGFCLLCSSIFGTHRGYLWTSAILTRQHTKTGVFRSPS